MSDEDDITLLFKVRRTIMEMLRDRNYLVTDHDINMTIEQFVEMYGHAVNRSDLTVVTTKNNDISSQIDVFFSDDEKVGIAEIRELVNRMKSSKISTAILVVKGRLTNAARKLVGGFLGMLHLEIFLETELVINITKSFLVPEHQVLTDEEKKTLLEHYTVQETQLPQIKVSDPVAKYYGMKRGQVVRIIRQSETSGQYVTYRYAV